MGHRVLSKTLISLYQQKCRVLKITQHRGRHACNCQLLTKRTYTKNQEKYEDSADEIAKSMQLDATSPKIDINIRALI